jgi:alkylhydroperoxidase/carboxymuconolactone decarboxylase family protein YurZ
VEIDEAITHAAAYAGFPAARAAMSVATLIFAEIGGVQADRVPAGQFL